MRFLTPILGLLVPSIVHAIILNVPELGDIAGTNTTSAWTKRTIYQFLGIKFGKSTSGERRFMPPEPAGPWQGVYNATIEGIECPQVSKINDLINAPPDVDMEDCLLLNLYTPKIPDKQNGQKLLPVMVYIHGGGFYEGSARFFPPDYLLEQDVVLVVPQYRLGPLGFMSLHTDGIAGNVGLMDQVLALEWINKNIQYFGGDNSKVTLFGQSAGGCSLSLHLISPMVDPKLFQQVIVMSGSMHAPWAFNSDPVKYSRSLYKFLTNETQDVDVSVMEQEFKKSSLLEILYALAKQIKLDPTMLFKSSKAVVQKAGSTKYITETPRKMLEAGKFRTVPMMAGVTKHDGSFITAIIYDMIEKQNLLNDDNFLRNKLTKQILELSGLFDETNVVVDLFNEIYFRKLFEKNNLTFADLAPAITDIVGNTHIKAQTLKEAKINVKSTNLTYLYTFDYIGEHTRFGYGEDTSKYPFEGGVHHSDDLLYLFPYPYTSPLNANDTKIAKMTSQLWSSFAIDGKPMSEFLNFEWPRLQEDKNGPYMHINLVPSISDDFVAEEYKIASVESGSI